MSIEAMKQALEALKNYVNVVTSSNDPKDFGGVVDGGEPARQAITALRQAIVKAEKPWVKTYAGGKPNYTTPIHASDMSEKCVDETAKREHEPVAWHEPGAYGNVTTHKDWALANGWEPLYK
jgi:hypothetical protein